MRVVLTGGGTGGHIYPALAIGRQCLLEEPDSKLLYIGTERGLESGLVAREGIPFEAVHITGFQRKLSMHNFKTVIRFYRAAARSKKLLREFRPDIVVGTGGYVCGPVVYAAAKLGIPTLLHEQNVIPGLANRFLSKYADGVAVSFKGSENHFPKARHVFCAGNPSASAVLRADRNKGLASLNLSSRDRLVLVVGGSRGARALNSAVIGMMQELAELPDLHVIHVTGEIYYEEVRKQAADAGLQSSRLHLLPYVYNMHEVLAASSLIVSRSGASMLAEITALGLPAILIPSPNVTNNHQEANARWMQEEGAADLLLEPELTGERLAGRVRLLMSDPIKREFMGNCSRKLGMPGAAAEICKEMRRIILQRQSR